MALPSTGSINMHQVNVELKKSGTSIITLNDGNVRKLANKYNGTIGMSDLRGKKASEYVENYQIYSNSWEGKDVSGTFVINFPKKVIFGNLMVTAFDKNQTNGQSTKKSVLYINGINIKVGMGYDPPTTTLSINNTKSINGNYTTGSMSTPHGSGESGKILTINCKFTGELES